MFAEKRKADETSLVPVPAKKTRNEVTTNNKNRDIATTDSPRTSNLYAPIMLLDGHEAEVHCVDFHPEGQYLATAGFDRRIFLWAVYGECDNINVMSGHTGSISQIKFSTDGTNIFSCSTDNTLGLWDLAVGHRIKKYKGHMNFVNSIGVSRRGPQMICSGGDDATVKLWDVRKKLCTASLDATLQVTAVCFNDTTEQIFSGGLDNTIKVWDIRKQELLYTLTGHTDTVTSLSLSASGAYLLSNAMDNTVRIWDIRPFAPQERCFKILQGHQHNFEKNLIRCNWSPDGDRVISGSADRFVYVWDVNSRRLTYKLSGHNGCVNDVAFHPNEPIIVSVASDNKIYLGEIDP